MTKSEWPLMHLERLCMTMSAPRRRGRGRRERGRCYRQGRGDETDGCGLSERDEVCRFDEGLSLW